MCEPRDMLTPRKAVIALVCATAMVTPSAAVAASVFHQQPSAATSFAQKTDANGVEEPINLRADGRGKVAENAMPKPEKLFTSSELRSVFPQASAVSVDSDRYTFSFPKDASAHRSYVLVQVKQTGKAADVKGSWSASKKKHQARSAKYAGLYSFLGKRQNGVADSFTDGTTAHVLLLNEGAASYVTVSAVGTFGSTKEHEAARKDVRQRALPALVDLLGRKVATGNTVAEKKKAESKKAEERTKKAQQPRPATALSSAKNSSAKPSSARPSSAKG